MNEDKTYFVEVSNVNGTDDGKIEKFDDFDELLVYFFNLGRDAVTHKESYEWSVYEAEVVI